MRRSLLRYALGAALITLATAAAVATASLLTIDSWVDGPSFDVPTESPESGDPQTILLVGSDRRYRAGRGDARSDTLMLVRLDPDQEAISVLSIPRDLRVRIPGHGVDKINAAYSAGGLALVTETVRRLLSAGGERFAIHHAVAVDFGGFREAIDALGCLYVDVDRRYLHSNEGLAAEAHYDEIDLQPGYQRLCGADALDFARFRHLDNDLVRAARQQSLLRDLRDELGSSGQLSDLEPLARIAARSTDTDHELRTAAGAMRVLKLAAAQAGDPVRQVAFPATLGVSDVTASRTRVRAVVASFLDPPESGDRGGAGARGGDGAGRSSRSGRAAGRRAADDDLVPFAPTVSALVRFPVYLPTRLTADARVPDAPRAYAIRGPDGRVHQAYRLVIAQNPALGRYYGVQGTTWRDPPLLDHVDARRRIGGRTYLLVRAGERTRYVAWRTREAVYWVSNTLTLDLRDGELLAVARSLRRFS